MIEMLQNTETSFVSNDSPRRRSTFYVPLVSEPVTVPIETSPTTECLLNIQKSLETLYNPDLSACSFEWSLDTGGESSHNNSDSLLSSAGGSTESTSSIPKFHLNRAKRYGVVLNGIDIDVKKCHSPSGSNGITSNNIIEQTSTPIKLTKSTSRSSILTSLTDKTKSVTATTTQSPIKEKSKTLPQNMSPTNAFPPKNSFLLKSTPRISFNHSISSSDATTTIITTPSPRKSLSFIRRAHSTKLSRSNSLLKSLTSKCIDHNAAENLCRVAICELQLERLERFFKADNRFELVRELFFKDGAATKAKIDRDDDSTTGGADSDSGKEILLFFFFWKCYHCDLIFKYYESDIYKDARIILSVRV